jgi:alpha-beta hydrolase superfamily lysophospholipase
VDVTDPRRFVSYDSILLSHGAPRPRAYVLLHGMSASPLQFAEFASRLYARGANVYVPRLPQHGFEDRMSTALGDLTARELRTFARDSVAAAYDLGTEVHVVGFSLGGLLAAWIAQTMEVARVTAIAPFLGVAGLPRRFTPGAAEFALRAPNAMLWWNPLLRERLGPAHGYPRFATHAVAQASRLASGLFALAAVEAPRASEIAIVLNAFETTVNNRAARRLAWEWAREARQRTHLYRMKGLGPAHDIIEPMRSPENIRRVYPPLVDLVAR